MILLIIIIMIMSNANNNEYLLLSGSLNLKSEPADTHRGKLSSASDFVSVYVSHNCHSASCLTPCPNNITLLIIGVSCTV